MHFSHLSQHVPLAISEPPRVTVSKFDDVFRILQDTIDSKTPVGVRFALERLRYWDGEGELDRRAVSEQGIVRICGASSRKRNELVGVNEGILVQARIAGELVQVFVTYILDDLTGSDIGRVVHAGSERAPLRDWVRLFEFLEYKVALSREGSRMRERWGCMTEE